MKVQVRGCSLEMIDWLHENVGVRGEDWGLTMALESLNDFVNNPVPLYNVYFQDERDATLFILRWS